MEAVFIKLFNMSITASYLALTVIVIRLIFKRLPKTALCFMWALVGIRLICPFLLESELSIIPSADIIPQDILTSEAPAIHSGIPVINSTVNPIISQPLKANAAYSINPVQIIIFIASVIWIAGILIMLIYAFTSYMKIHKRVCESVKIKDNIWICDRISTPFVLGIINPHIYVPSNTSQTDIGYILLHENAHIARKDYIWKPFGFFILTIYWLNPIIWISYMLLCHDIELACDENVIRNHGTDIKKQYCNALINCSIPRKAIAVCPLAFGEDNVKRRIKSVLNYKRPAFWIVATSFILCILTAVCLLTNPKKADKLSDFSLEGYKCDYTYITENDSSTITLAYQSKNFTFSISNLSSYYPIGKFEEIHENSEDFIILKANDGKNQYTFKKGESSLIFVADKSSEMPYYKYSADSSSKVCIPDGAVFQENAIYTDRIKADIDGDDIEEICTLGIGPTSGMFTFTLSASVNGKIKYSNIFYIDFCHLTFIKDDNDNLKIKSTTDDKKPKAYLLDISIEDGDIILSENGIPLKQLKK